MRKVILLAIFALLGFSGNFQQAAKLYIQQSGSAEVIEMFKKSCYDDKNPAGCYSAAFLIEASYIDDTKNEVYELYKIACDMGDMSSCGAVASMYDSGKMSENFDIKQVIYYHQKACDGDVAASCFEIAKRYDAGNGLEKDYSKAVVLYKKSCDSKIAAACFNAANMIEFGDGTPKDIKAAIQYYGLACDYGDSGGCVKFRELSK